MKMGWWYPKLRNTFKGVIGGYTGVYKDNIGIYGVYTLGCCKIRGACLRNNQGSSYIGVCIRD